MLVSLAVASGNWSGGRQTRMNVTQRKKHNINTSQLWSCQGHDQGRDHGQELCPALHHDTGQDLVKI